MSTIIPSISEAVACHDAAHEKQDSILHFCAVKLLALNGVDHVQTTEDAFDVGLGSTALDGLPASVLVKDEVAALQGGELRTEDKFLHRRSPIIFDNVQVTLDLTYRHRKRIPAYDLYAIRRLDEEEIVPSEQLPAKFLHIGHVRRNGVYRFPIVAWQIGDNYQLIQVVKDGDNVSIFNRDGVAIDIMEGSVADAFLNIEGENLIAEGIYYDDKFIVHDLLMLDGVDMTNVVWEERFAMIPTGLRSDLMVIPTQVSTADQLTELETGTWLIKHIYDIIDDTQRPYWFEHVVGKVKVHQPLPPLSIGNEPESFDGDMLITWLPEGPFAQIHKDKNLISLYLDRGARNRTEDFPLISEAMEQMPESIVLDGVFSCSRNGQPLRLFDPSENFSECEYKFYCTDVPYINGIDRTALPMMERSEIVEELISDNDNIIVNAYDNKPSDDCREIAWSCHSPRKMRSTDKTYCWAVQ